MSRQNRDRRKRRERQERKAAQQAAERASEGHSELNYAHVLARYAHMQCRSLVISVAINSPPAKPPNPEDLWREAYAALAAMLKHKLPN